MLEGVESVGGNLQKMKIEQEMPNSHSGLLPACQRGGIIFRCRGFNWPTHKFQGSAKEVENLLW